MGGDQAVAFRAGLSVRELARAGHGRNTIRRALRSEHAPRYVRGRGRSILDPFKEEIRRLLREIVEGAVALVQRREQGLGAGAL